MDRPTLLLTNEVARREVTEQQAAHPSIIFPGPLLDARCQESQDHARRKGWSQAAREKSNMLFKILIGTCCKTLLVAPRRKKLESICPRLLLPPELPLHATSFSTVLQVREDLHVAQALHGNFTDRQVVLTSDSKRACWCKDCLGGKLLP